MGKRRKDLTLQQFNTLADSIITIHKLAREIDPDVVKLRIQVGFKGLETSMAACIPYIFGAEEFKMYTEKFIEQTKGDTIEHTK